MTDIPLTGIISSGEPTSRLQADTPRRGAVDALCELRRLHLKRCGPFAPIKSSVFTPYAFNQTSLEEC